MTELRIKIQGQAPTYQSEGAAGCDIVASEETTIPANGRAIVPTGLFLEIPQGFEAQVRSRSGLAAKEGVFVLNSPGTIDSDYRGEVKVILYNTTGDNFIVKKGDRVAQLIFSRVYHAAFEVTRDLSQTKRAAGGFGSTGKS